VESRRTEGPEWCRARTEESCCVFRQCEGVTGRLDDGPCRYRPDGAGTIGGDSRAVRHRARSGTAAAPNAVSNDSTDTTKHSFRKSGGLLSTGRDDRSRRRR